MKKYFLFLFFVPLTIFSQTSISGIVKDETGKALPFANIVTDTNQGTITDIDGKFEIQTNENFNAITISYIGYFTKTTPVNQNTSFYTVILKENVEELNAIVVTGGENPAIEIIRNAIRSRDDNNAEKVLNSFKFNTYNKLIVTANPDSVNSKIDSVFIRKEGKLVFDSVDSTKYEFKKQLDKSHLFIGEKVSEYSFNQSKGKRETILASRLAGFKDPIYELLGIQIQSFSFYDNDYTIFGTNYTNPIATNAIRQYNYKILDTVNRQANRPAYMIYYYPKRTGDVAGLEGVLYIDTETYALQEAIAQVKAAIEIRASQKFQYFENEKLWFPSEKEVTIKQGENEQDISLLGMPVPVRLAMSDTTLVRTNNQNLTELIHLVSKETNFDIELNQAVKIRGRGIAIDFVEQATKRDENYWKQYRTDTLTERGRETYKVIDSVIESQGIEKKVKLARKLLDGYFPTKYFDFDLKFLIKFNDFEGFKPGVGILTNDAFSTKFKIFAYGVYGFGDRDFKFGTTLSARLNRHTNTWTGLSYIDNLGETGSAVFNTDGRSFSPFEPRLFNLVSFYKTRQINPFIEHDITAKFQSKLQLSYNEVDPQFDYTFVTGNGIFTEFNLTTAALTFQWNPKDTYILTPEGKKTSSQAFPKFTFQAIQSFENLVGGDFNFTQFDFRAIHEISTLNGSSTNFLLRAGIGFGDIPLTHLYSFSPNGPDDENIIGRFSVADSNSFETLRFNEFFADRFATFQVRHKFRRFKVTRRVRPELVLASRAAFGTVSDIERHQDIEFDTLEDGFYESGFELNKIFYGFGLSFFYRYGPNGLDGFADNVSFKFTFNFDFGL